jgi:hypothetical protein
MSSKNLLIKATDFRWKLPFIFRTYRFLMHVLVKATSVWRTDFAGGFYSLLNKEY